MKKLGSGTTATPLRNGTQPSARGSVPAYACVAVDTHDFSHEISMYDDEKSIGSAWLLLFVASQPQSVQARDCEGANIKFLYAEMLVINPRRACAARVTVLGLSVLPSVRQSVCPVPLILALRATRRPKRATNGFSATLA